MKFLPTLKAMKRHNRMSKIITYGVRFIFFFSSGFSTEGATA